MVVAFHPATLTTRRLLALPGPDFHRLELASFLAHWVDTSSLPFFRGAATRANSSAGADKRSVALSTQRGHEMRDAYAGVKRTNATELPSAIITWRRVLRTF